jgi:hypothetical protein
LGPTMERSPDAAWRKAAKTNTTKMNNYFYTINYQGKIYHIPRLLVKIIVGKIIIQAAESKKILRIT